MVDGYPIARDTAERMRREFREEREQFREKHIKAMLDYLTFDFDIDD